MSALLARTMMALARATLDARRRDWAAAMDAEFAAAEADGHALSFASGCLLTAWRELLTLQEGRFTLTSYALVLAVVLPMAALQIGCAVLGLPYLYPGPGGLRAALLVGGAHEDLLRGLYQAAVPSLALLLLLLGLVQLRLGWAVLERDWAAVRRRGLQAIAATVTLIIVMATLFLDGRQVLVQAAVLTVELATIVMVARWHEQLFPAPAEHPG